MTTELAILLGVFAFIILGSFYNKDHGVEATFKKAAPRLGARVERHLETGAGFEGGWEGPGVPSKRFGN